MAETHIAKPEVPIDPNLICDFCDEVTFAAGDPVKIKGQHSDEMFLLTEGEVEIALERPGKPPQILTRGHGSPIGEISFLTGCTVTANVRARTRTRALRITDVTLKKIENERPELAAELYRKFADVAEGRQSYNLVYFSEGAEAGADQRKNDLIEVRICRTPQMLFDAQRIRYQVYVEELGRTSPHADSINKTIADELDNFAQVLLAFENGTPIGTMRLNAAKDGPLGAYEQIYGMGGSASHPDHTAICTKFIVTRSHRYGQASFKLMATSVSFGRHTKVKQCYIDCIPQLLPFYMSLGFRQSAPAFLHRENGRSIPMSLDLDRYASRIARLTGFVLK